MLMTADHIRSMKLGLFSERETTTRIIDEVQAEFSKVDQARVVTYLMLYHNTLLELLAKETEK